MRWVKSARDAADREDVPRGQKLASDISDAREVLALARMLRSMIKRVSPEEFYWQEARYDYDSRLGRELLFLIANHEWVRATSEIVELSLSDIVETTIKIDLDLSEITHEAFRNRSGRLWLPVAVLPPAASGEEFQGPRERPVSGPAGVQPAAGVAGENGKAAEAGERPRGEAGRPGGAGERSLDPDPLATVTDASGNLLPMLPNADLRHRISAAMAEIIVNMAVSHSRETVTGPAGLSDRPKEQVAAVATRDQRLLLSAGIYRMFGRGSGQGGEPEPGLAVESDRLEQARGQLLPLLRRYTSYLEQAVPTGTVRPPDHAQGARDQGIQILENLSEQVCRALTYLPNQGLGKDFIRAYVYLWEIYQMIVSPAAGEPGPVLSGRARETRAAIGKQDEFQRPPQFAPELARRAVKVLQGLAESLIIVVPMNYDLEPTVLTVRLPPRNMRPTSRPGQRTWRSWTIRPSGHLDLGVLLPTSDADRQIQIHLPDGVSVEKPEEPQGSGHVVSPCLTVGVQAPPPLGELVQSVNQVFASQASGWPAPLVQSLIDLTRAKAALVLDTLRHYEARQSSTPPTSADHESTGADRIALKNFARQLDRHQEMAGWAKTAFRWREFSKSMPYLFRRTTAIRASPRTVVARIDSIEHVPQRAIPLAARIQVDFAADDHDNFSTARTSSFMGLILMTGVFAFVLFWSQWNPKVKPAPEVLAIVLTLFATIQASTFERPDRSTLRGQLTATGSWLKAASVLPAVILAVALAFRPIGTVAVFSALGGVAAQALVLLLMWRGPLTRDRSPRVGQRRGFETAPLDYRHFEALRSDYWRNTTADALMIGRMAYGYVLWQRANPGPGHDLVSPPMTSLLSWRQDASAVDESSSVLALLRSGTLHQSTTFIVFRGKPEENWAADAVIREELDLDPDRLAPQDSVTSMVDIFVALRRDKIPGISQHPVVSVLKAAANRLIVLEAQLPVPAAIPGWENRQWGRVRVALRDAGDIRRLTDFLGAVYDEVARKGEGAHAVAVRTVPSPSLGIIPGPPGSEVPEGYAGVPLLAGQGSADGHDWPGMVPQGPGGRLWRVMVACADARSNIESEMVQHLASGREQSQLAGLTYALLHGMAVVVLLLGDKTGVAPADPGNGRVTEDKAGLAGIPRVGSLKEQSRPPVRVLVNRELSPGELGPMMPYPLLQVRFRWQDRPGALLYVLNAIRRVIEHELPSVSISVSYASIQVVTGRVALGRLAVRVHVREIPGWDAGKCEEIGRKVSVLAVLEAQQNKVDHRAVSDLDKPEEPVVRMKLSWQDEGRIISKLKAEGKIR